MLTLHRRFSRSGGRGRAPSGVAVANAYQHVVCVAMPAGELSDDELRRAAMDSGAFDFWNDPAEEVYTIGDGEPV